VLWFSISRRSSPADPKQKPPARHWSIEATSFASLDRVADHQADPLVATFSFWSRRLRRSRARNGSFTRNSAYAIATARWHVGAGHRDVRMLGRHSESKAALFERYRQFSRVIE